MTSPLPTVHVVGEAERRVAPDRVVVTITVRTPVLADPAEALALGVQRRSRVRAALADGVPDAVVSDARVTTVPQYENVEEPDALGRTTSRTVLRGHVGLCRMSAEAEAARAAAIMAVAGTHPDVDNASPAFAIGPELRRATERELEQAAGRDAIARARGLATAAGRRLGDVLAIGEPPAGGSGRDEAGWTSYALKAEMAVEVEEALGELVPEPQTLAVSVPVSLALLPGD